LAIKSPELQGVDHRRPAKSSGGEFVNDDEPSPILDDVLHVARVGQALDWRFST